MRVRKRAGRHAAARRAAAIFTSPSGRFAIVGVLTVGVVIAVTPANGAATDIVSHVTGAVRDLASSKSVSANGASFSGTPAVGALFTSSNGKLGSHFCTASVVNSPHGDLAITAAHCMTNLSSGATVVFIPGYNSGKAPYGTWKVTKVYVDQAWTSSQSQNDDVAFIRLSQPGSVPIQDVTGAETLATKTAARQLVTVIGYPDGGTQAITCENWTSQPMVDQLQFDCGGYTDGTSGGPFLADISTATGQGTLVGIIGGLQQGGDTPQVSYSIEFEQNVTNLYATAVAGG
jgi:V8-like Glu-specific endopeptidase